MSSVLLQGDPINDSVFIKSVLNEASNLIIVGLEAILY